MSGFTAIMNVPRTGWTASSRDRRRPLRSNVSGGTGPIWGPAELRDSAVDRTYVRSGYTSCSSNRHEAGSKPSPERTFVPKDWPDPLAGRLGASPGHIATGYRAAEKAPLYVGCGPGGRQRAFSLDPKPGSEVPHLRRTGPLPRPPEEVRVTGSCGVAPNQGGYLYATHQEASRRTKPPFISARRRDRRGRPDRAEPYRTSVRVTTPATFPFWITRTASRSFRSSTRTRRRVLPSTVG